MAAAAGCGMVLGHDQGLARDDTRAKWHTHACWVPIASTAMVCTVQPTGMTYELHGSRIAMAADGFGQSKNLRRRMASYGDGNGTRRRWERSGAGGLRREAQGWPAGA